VRRVLAGEWRADAISAYAEQVRPTTAPYIGKGRCPRWRYHDKPSSLDSLALQVGQQACVELIWRRGSKSLRRGRFLVLRVRPAGGTPRRQARADGAELPLHWLLVEWPTGKPAPVKYWLSNLPCGYAAGRAGPPGQVAVKSRAGIQGLKGALGLDHSPRVLVLQRPSHVARLHPSHPASGRPIGSGKRVGSSPRCCRGHPAGGRIVQ
jgi:hypothetical protein